MSRLPPRKEDLRNLALKSKNKCAFPGCDHLILNADGDYVAQLCHIEAAAIGGQRYNQNQTDEDRRSPSNLLFLCHEHHKVTDDVVQYPVKKLQEMKRAHEALPAVIFNSELLLQRLDEVIAEQAVIRNILEGAPQVNPIAGTYPIVGPELEEAWTPQEGRFYKTHTGPNTWSKYMMREGWLHIEQQLEDGAIVYFEVNEAGNIRNPCLPYPIHEYRIVIPEKLVLRREQIPSTVGTHAIESTLKWSNGTVVEHFNGSMLAGFECPPGPGYNIDLKARTITILGDGSHDA